MRWFSFILCRYIYIILSMWSYGSYVIDVMLCWMPLHKKSQAYYISSITHSTRQLLNEATKFSTKSRSFMAWFLAENLRNDDNPKSWFWEMEVLKATRSKPFCSMPFLSKQGTPSVSSILHYWYIPTNKNQRFNTLSFTYLDIIITSIKLVSRCFKHWIFFFFCRLDLRDHVLFDEFCHFTAIKWKAMLPRWVVWELGVVPRFLDTGKLGRKT